jgi:hypothetical protein
MSPEATEAEVSGRRALFRSPVLLALALAGFLWGLVLFLSWIGPSEVPITDEQFRRLEANGMLAAIAVGEDGLRCRLRQRVRIASSGQDVPSEHVFLLTQGGVAEERLQAWGAAGISVTRARPEEGSWRNAAGLALVGGLLAVGVWHLWSQVRADRRAGSSPRQRLQRLEEDYKAGRLSPEEYRRQLEAISAEL